jgi:phosphopantothenoylcysteine decarboxylase/phosphopantothenate--cysteine ligase
MWDNPATQHNVETLRSRGIDIVGPDSGELTGGDSGVGRLANLDEIVDIVWSAATARDLVGTRVLITAGGTREPIDPVRYIGNRSTGNMGVACARVARDRGASVTLIASHLEVDPPVGVSVVQVSTASEMRDAVMNHLSAVDVFVSVAAVSDFRVANASSTKLSKWDGVPHLTLELNPDILREVVAQKSVGCVVGFAAETDTENFLERASAKAIAKGTDILVANLVGATIGFGNVPTTTVLIDSEGSVVDTVMGKKIDIATRIFDLVSRQKETMP